ncbi:MAG: polyprenyl synthetase family protein, partial [Chloroflexi bacterium]|nr:polyprenyl synthetase family protein [Chloroflexota bacterium]
MRRVPGDGGPPRHLQARRQGDRVAEGSCHHLHGEVGSGSGRLQHAHPRQSVGRDRQTVLPFAVAAELIHTYTLIHDDLPALDNDDFRRGKPTSHKVYGEAIAILAGDALLTQAFILMTNTTLLNGIPAKEVLKAAHDMAQALGTGGMIGGQVVDLESEGKPVSPEALEYIHIYKTGHLIRACVRGGA